MRLLGNKFTFWCSVCYNYGANIMYYLNRRNIIVISFSCNKVDRRHKHIHLNRIFEIDNNKFKFKIGTEKADEAITKIVKENLAKENICG